MNTPAEEPLFNLNELARTAADRIMSNDRQNIRDNDCRKATKDVEDCDIVLIVLI